MQSFFKKSIVVGTLTVIMSPLFVGTFAHAQTPTPVTVITDAGSKDSRLTYTLLAPLPCVNQTGDCTNGLVTRVTLVTYFNILFKLSIALASVLAVFMIVYGGFKYLSTDAISGHEEGKEIITRAVEGLLFVLASYFILYTINPKYVQIDANIIPPLCDPENPVPSVCIGADYEKAVDIIDQQKVLSSQAKEKIATIDAQTQKLRNERDSAYEDGEFTKGAQLEAQAVELDKQRVYVLTEEVGSWQYLQATNILSTDPLSDNGIQQVQDAKDKLDKQYTDGINKLNAAGDAAGVDKLRSERFYKDTSIEDEKTTAQAIKSYEDYHYTSYNNPIAASVDPKIAVNAAIKQLQDNETKNANLITDPGNKAQYIQETQDRIKRLQAVLNGK